MASWCTSRSATLHISHLYMCVLLYRSRTAYPPYICVYCTYILVNFTTHAVTVTLSEPILLHLFCNGCITHGGGCVHTACNLLLLLLLLLQAIRGCHGLMFCLGTCPTCMCTPLTIPQNPYLLRGEATAPSFPIMCRHTPGSCVLHVSVCVRACVIYLASLVSSQQGKCVVYVGISRAYSAR